MEHKGLPVHGYQPQSSDRVAVVNGNKVLEELVLRALDAHAESDEVDKRWLAIARTGIEQGFMALNRAVFRPARIALPEDATASRRPSGAPPGGQPPAGGDAAVRADR